MKILVSALLSLSLVAGLAPLTAAPAAAEKSHSVKKKKKKIAKIRRYRVYGYAPSHYYERLADRQPLGTSRWWHQMDSEQRGGRR